MIKAIIFDIDGVLIDSLDANTKFFQDLIAAAGYKRPSKVAYAEIFYKSMREVIEIFTRAPEEEVRRIWELGHKYPYPTNLLKMTKNSRETIEKLSKEYRLALVTSRIKAGVKNFYKVSKMKGRFSVCVSYEDTKNHKPHPEPLLLALKKLKVKPEDAVYIGDAETDIKAAKAARMKVILFSKKRVSGADRWIKSFDKLLEAIKSLD